ncbi:MAG: acetylesterase [Pisciglobus halotolerans]|nr:acetylesterase [Pisciglobus halotolerans]
MAIVTGSFQSNELMRKMSFSAVIPTERKATNTSDTKEIKPFKTLYLLHGWNGNHEDWLQGSRIAEIAEKHRLAVIMPSGENSFYVDHENGNNYGKFIGEELVAETRKLFHLSHKKEETFIGGLSMGGYGALRNGLLYSQTFSKIIALSSKMLSRDFGDKLVDEIGRGQLQSLIGLRYKDMPIEMDLAELAEKALLLKEEKPEIFIACGTEDNLIQENQAYHDFLNQLKYPHIYKTAPGGHEWPFWDTYIEIALERMLH